MDQAEKWLAGRTPRFGLGEQGMHHLGPVHWNLTAPYLYEHAVQRREGTLGFGGSFVVNTGRHTGRSPKDKYIVNEPGTKDTVWWGDINQPIEAARFDSLQQRMLAYLQGKELFVQDLYAGADPEYRLPVRVISDGAWPSLFSRNMFIRPRRPSCRISSRPSRSCTRRISARYPSSTGSARRPSSWSTTPPALS